VGPEKLGSLILGHSCLAVSAARSSPASSSARTKQNPLIKTPITGSLSRKKYINEPFFIPHLI
jgi:hypothetical protein